MRSHTSAILVNYGTHRIFTDAGNRVECRFCQHFEADRCLHHDEPATPNGRCFANAALSEGAALRSW